jgi:hypothetical protein
MEQPDNNDPKRPHIIIDGRPVYVDQLGQQPGFGVPGQQPKRRGIGCWIIGILLFILLPLVIVGVVVMSVLGALGGSLGGLGDIGNMVSTAVKLTSGPETKPVSGDPSHFDPLAGLADAQAFAGSDAELVSIVASYVRSDGTMDLTATYKPAPNTEYKFLREVPKPADAPPVGAGGTKGGKWYQPITIDVYEPGQTRHVTSIGGGISTEYNYTNQGMEKNLEDPTTNPSDEIISAPTCSFADFWKEALKKDAPSDAVAVIEYNSDGYEFNIVGTLVLRFDQDCNLVK